MITPYTVFLRGGCVYRSPCVRVSFVLTLADKQATAAF
jgi:hypothetical protein